MRHDRPNHGWQMVTHWCYYHRRLELETERSRWHHLLDEIFVRRWLIYIAVTVVAMIAMMVWLHTPIAEAHSTDELAHFVEHWQDEAGADPTPEDIAEWQDWVDRHPWYFVYTAPTATKRGLSASQPSSPTYAGGVEQWRYLVVAYFPADQVDKAMAVMACESGGNPNADNPSSSAAGLFQFLKSTWDNMVPLSVTGGSYASGQVYDPEANVRAAAWLLAAEGWSQWSCA